MLPFATSGGGLIEVLPPTSRGYRCHRCDRNDGCADRADWHFPRAGHLPRRLGFAVYWSPRGVLLARWRFAWPRYFRFHLFRNQRLVGLEDVREVGRGAATPSSTADAAFPGTAERWRGPAARQFKAMSEVSFANGAANGPHRAKRGTSVFRVHALSPLHRDPICEMMSSVDRLLTLLACLPGLALIAGEIYMHRTRDDENDQRIDLGWKPKRRD